MQVKIRRLRPPRVKRLEWEDAPRGSDGMEVAHAPGGSGIAYLVRDSSEKKGFASLWMGFEHYGDHASRAEAKAAAQADFERRILSALEDDDG